MREFTGFKKGVNLGGWLSQCGEENYHEAHYQSFIKEDDIKEIASWGVDHVRMPVDYNVIQTEDGKFIESGFAHINDCVAWCKKYHLNIVFDIHKTKGYVFDNDDYMTFFDDVSLQDQFVSLWEEIIKRYGQYSDMMAFELLNEITEERFAKKWNEIADRTVKAIRKINKDARIIIGGIYNSSIYGMLLLDPPADENIVYTIHVYSPMVFTHQTAQWVKSMPIDFHIHYPGTVASYKEESHKIFGNSFDHEFDGLSGKNMDSEFFDHIFIEAVNFANERNAPLYCGEYGVIDQTNPEEQLAWYKDIHAVYEKYDIARSAWSYKKMDFGLSDERLKNILPELIKVL